MGTDDIVKVDYDLGGQGYVDQFRGEQLGEVECGCCDLIVKAKECEAVSAVTQRTISSLDADLIRLKGEMDAGDLQVKNTDMKEKALEDQIAVWDRDIDLADDAVDAKDNKLMQLEKTLRAREEALDGKEANLQLSVGEEENLRQERISMFETDLFSKQDEIKDLTDECHEEGLIGSSAATAYNTALRDKYEFDLEDENTRLSEISEECANVQKEICGHISKVSSTTLGKIERKEQKTALLVRKHAESRNLRAQYQSECEMLLKRIQQLEGEGIDGEQEELEVLGSDDEMDSTLQLLLELPAPTSALIDAFKDDPDMDPNLIALQAMMGHKTKSWPKVVMFLEGVLEWNAELIAEVEQCLHGVADGVTWTKLHNVFEHIVVHAGMKLEHRPWWRTGEWKWVQQ
eukprot:TRINITY_DN18020_c0_g1_i2.p1 TRINITY_DN18020_c0_g1~~TRINITY_DN18020_c0_g1_i2.p1  ORF type:complete len:403 (-),score=135.25 TRINITY_DN18020_c0_g1_i2:332-1540(-)